MTKRDFLVIMATVAVIAAYAIWTGHKTGYDAGWKDGFDNGERYGELHMQNQAVEAGVGYWDTSNGHQFKFKN